LKPDIDALEHLLAYRGTRETVVSAGREP